MPTRVGGILGDCVAFLGGESVGASKPALLAPFSRGLFPSHGFVFDLAGGNLRHLDRGPDHITRPFLSGWPFGIDTPSLILFFADNTTKINRHEFLKLRFYILATVAPSVEPNGAFPCILALRVLVAFFDKLA